MGAAAVGCVAKVILLKQLHAELMIVCVYAGPREFLPAGAI
jgi:hypothetical protein